MLPGIGRGKALGCLLPRDFFPQNPLIGPQPFCQSVDKSELVFMQTKPNIFEYLDYRSFLKNLFAFKKVENPSFSHRSFARLAGLQSSNFLKLVMDGQRNLSAKAIHSFAKAFKLNKSESDFFEALVFFNQSKSMEEKNRYYDRIAQFKKYHDAKPLDVHQYTYFSNWYFVALRELTLLKSFKEDPVWINKKLKARIHPDEIKRAIRILIDLKLLHRDDAGRLKQSDAKISSSPEMGILAVYNFHREMIQKAGESIERSLAEHRDISGLTLALSKKQFEKIRLRLNEIRREIHELSCEGEDKEAVYQVNFQLFNLSEVIW